MPTPRSWPTTPKMAANYLGQVIRDAARLPCNRRDCGTVCLCLGCAARYALPYYAVTPAPTTPQGERT